MAWTEIADSETTLAAAERLVKRATDWRRWLGTKQAFAMEDAALALGTSPRRIRSLLRGEVFKVAADECRRMQRRFWADMDRAASELRARAAEMEQEAEAERLAALQLSLNLEIPGCSPRSVHGSFSGVGGGR